MFVEPWAHEAEWYRNRHDLTGPDRWVRTAAEIKQPVWAYKDARFRGDDPAADAAWRAFRRTGQRLRERGDDWYVRTATYEMLHVAAAFDDIDRAARELLEWYPRVDTRDLESDNERRTDARTFISACIQVLVREASIRHPHEAAIDAAMRDVAARSADVLTTAHRDGFRRIGEVRALRLSREALAATRRSDVVTGDGLPRVDAALAREALVAADVHDDVGALDALVRRLARAGTVPSLLHLLQARRQLAVGDLDAAISDLDLAARATDPRAPRLRPQIHATLGRIRVMRDPEALDDGIEACRTGRRLGLRWWRHTTAADTSLARLLLWRALAPGTPPDQRADDVREAVRLARRRCRPWHRPGADDKVVLHDALAAHESLTGTGTNEQRQRAWRRSLDASWSAPERARLATAWVAWAVGTGDPELAAEAYRHLVALVPLDTAARYGPGAKQRVLAAAQEHTEEAGYWLARTRRYREAVLALETGRAVGLSEATSSDGADGGDGGPVAEVRYDDITAVSGDGALVYLAAAKAGGYALIVTGRHDPQFMELPTLDRRTVSTLLGTLLPDTDDRGGPGATRDVGPVQPQTEPLAAALRTLWENCIRDLILHSARGRVVTLVPVGLLSLLPLHAAGEPGAPSDTYTGWRHAGHFSAIRYAPNARSLRRCRDIARDLATGEQRVLAVDVPDGFGIGASGHLHFVARETTEIIRRWPSGGMVTHDCTWARFRDAADDYPIWHLACHGSAMPRSILDSRLYFADRQVTLAELRQALRPGRRRLAILSACESNLIGTALPNEVVGLPSALLQIGFAGVIASSWKVDDLATAYLMTEFYRQWCREATDAAVALNRAQQWLRTASRSDLTALLPGTEPPDNARHPYADPRYWAAFAYTGA